VVFGAIAGIALAADPEWDGHRLSPSSLATPAAVELALGGAVTASVARAGRLSLGDVLARLTPWLPDPRLDGATRGALALTSAGVRAEDAGYHLWRAGYRPPVPAATLLRTLPAALIYAESTAALVAASLDLAALRSYDPFHRLATVVFNALVAAACGAEGPEATLARAGDALGLATRHLVEAADDEDLERVIAASAGIRRDLRGACDGVGATLPVAEDEQGHARELLRAAVGVFCRSRTAAEAYARLPMAGPAAPLAGVLLGARHGEHGLPALWHAAVARDAEPLLASLLG